MDAAAVGLPGASNRANAAVSLRERLQNMTECRAWTKGWAHLARRAWGVGLLSSETCRKSAPRPHDRPYNLSFSTELSGYCVSCRSNASRANRAVCLEARTRRHRM